MLSKTQTKREKDEGEKGEEGFGKRESWDKICIYEYKERKRYKKTEILFII